MISNQASLYCYPWLGKHSHGYAGGGSRTSLGFGIVQPGKQQIYIILLPHIITKSKLLKTKLYMSYLNAINKYGV
jgi:hypothetical protein